MQSTCLALAAAQGAQRKHAQRLEHPISAGTTTHDAQRGGGGRWLPAAQGAPRPRCPEVRAERALGPCARSEQMARGCPCPMFCVCVSVISSPAPRHASYCRTELICDSMDAQVGLWAITCVSGEVAVYFTATGPRAGRHLCGGSGCAPATPTARPPAPAAHGVAASFFSNLQTDSLPPLKVVLLRHRHWCARRTAVCTGQSPNARVRRLAGQEGGALLVSRYKCCMSRSF